MGIQLGTSTISKVYLGNTEIQKVYLGSNLVYSSAFNPLSLSPSLWLDSADLSTITLSGNKITQINDKSNNGNNFYSSNLTYSPIYDSGSMLLNGSQYIYSDTIMDLGIYGSNIEFEMFFVLKSTNTTLNNNIMVKRQWWSSDAEILLYNKNGLLSSRKYAQNGIFTPPTINQVNTTGLIDNQLSIVNSYFSSNKLELNYNNANYNSNTVDNGGLTRFNYPMVIGTVEFWNASAYGGLYGLIGRLYEVLFFNYKLSEGERTNVYNYLNNKWN